MCVEFKCAIHLTPASGTHCPEVAAKSCKAGSRSTLIVAFCSGHAGGEMGQRKELLYKPDCSQCLGYILLCHATNSAQKTSSILERVPICVLRQAFSVNSKAGFLATFSGSSKPATETSHLDFSHMFAVSVQSRDSSQRHGSRQHYDKETL